MNIFVARQPVFDRRQRVLGYELLYRSGMTNKYDGTDGTEASLAVIRNTFLFLGKQKVTPSTFAFINFTKQLLMSGVAETLPPAQTVIEILDRLVLAYESGDWQKLDLITDGLHTEVESIPSIYLAAVERADEIIKPAQ